MAIADTLTLRPSTAFSAARPAGLPPTPDAPGLSELRRWVDDVVALTRPDRVHWVDGTPA